MQFQKGNDSDDDYDNEQERHILLLSRSGSGDSQGAACVRNLTIDENLTIEDMFQAI